MRCVVSSAHVRASSVECVSVSVDLIRCKRQSIVKVWLSRTSFACPARGRQRSTCASLARCYATQQQQQQPCDRRKKRHTHTRSGTNAAPIPSHPPAGEREKNPKTRRETYLLRPLASTWVGSACVIYCQLMLTITTFMTSFFPLETDATHCTAATMRRQIREGDKSAWRWPSRWNSSADNVLSLIESKDDVGVAPESPGGRLPLLRVHNQ